MQSNKPNKYLIVGKSATGKTTIIDEVCKKYNYKSIQSYTTRKPRYKGEGGHIFTNEEKYFQDLNDGKIIAYTYFNNAHYYATIEQLEDEFTIFYIIDSLGIQYLQEKVGDKFNFKTIYINIPLHIRIFRILKRDGFKKAISRLWNDYKMFKDLQYDYEIFNFNLEESINELHNIIKENESR